MIVVSFSERKRIISWAYLVFSSLVIFNSESKDSSSAVVLDASSLDAASWDVNASILACSSRIDSESFDLVDSLDSFDSSVIRRKL